MKHYLEARKAMLLPFVVAWTKHEPHSAEEQRLKNTWRHAKEALAAILLQSTCRNCGSNYEVSEACEMQDQLRFGRSA